MATTDQRTCLLMSTATLNDLWLRASIVAQRVDAQQLMAAIRGREAVGIRWRVRCDEPALDFIRERAPELARRWPSVFGRVAVPRAASIGQAMAMVGQTVAGIESDGGGLRLQFESGDALLIGAAGELDWREGGDQTDGAVCACGHSRHWHGAGARGMGSGCCEHDADCPCSGFVA